MRHSDNPLTGDNLNACHGSPLASGNVPRRFAPITLFAYKRASHLRRTVEALLENEFAQNSEVLIYSDAAKNEAAAEAVREVRAYIKTISGFSKICIIERDCNQGLASNIVNGVSDAVRRYGRVIVLEDDMITSRHFLRYMNDGLDAYATNDQVASIHGYLLPVKATLPETFFLRGADCWGWATWKRAWDLFEPDGTKLLNTIKSAQMENAIGPHYVRMLKDQIRGLNDSWAVRWHASAFVKGKYTLHPGRSLVVNIGIDSSGVHCDNVDVYRSALSESPVRIEPIPVIEDPVVQTAFREFWTTGQLSLRGRMAARIRKILDSLLRTSSC